MVWAHSPEGPKLDVIPKSAEMIDARLRSPRIGLLDNRKANAKLLLEELASRLGERVGGVSTYYFKPNASIASTPELLDRIAAEVDLVVTASAD